MVAKPLSFENDPAKRCTMCGYFSAVFACEEEIDGTTFRLQLCRECIRRRSWAWEQFGIVSVVRPYGEAELSNRQQRDDQGQQKPQKSADPWATKPRGSTRKRDT